MLSAQIQLHSIYTPNHTVTSSKTQRGVQDKNYSQGDGGGGIVCIVRIVRIVCIVCIARITHAGPDGSTARTAHTCPNGHDGHGDGSAHSHALGGRKETTSDDIANSGLYGGSGSAYIVRVSGSSGDQRGSPAIGPAAPNPTTPRTTGAKIGVRITPTVAPATPKTRGRISKCDR